MIKKYRKKPVVIEAVQWTGNNFREIYKLFSGNYPKLDSYMSVERWRDYTDSCVTSDRKLKLKTLKSDGEYQVADVGDYIVKGIKGEFYPVKPDIFKKTYEEIK